MGSRVDPALVTPALTIVTPFKPNQPQLYLTHNLYLYHDPGAGWSRAVVGGIGAEKESPIAGK